MLFKDYYKILGLENNKVDIEEIKIAFREQAKKYHPDVSDGSFAEERFKDINEAYRTLSNNKEKKKYDRIWYSHVGKKIQRNIDKQGRETKMSFLGILFGNQQNKTIKAEKVNKKIPIKGENIETEVEISVEEAFYGLDKKISLRTVEGKMKTFSVKIPAGIRNGERIRLIGEGKTGINGAKNGDLFIKINIDNSKKYKIHGYDMYTDLLISPWEAALGGKTQIETIENKNATIYIPKGTESGQTLKIPGEGYKDGKGGRGDLLLDVKIVVPKEISKEEEELYEKLKEISSLKNEN